jgi:hypothetical protein
MATTTKSISNALDDLRTLSQKGKNYSDTAVINSQEAVLKKTRIRISKAGMTDDEYIEKLRKRSPNGLTEAQESAIRSMLVNRELSKRNI